MKNYKKLLALILAAVMAMAMGVTAFAANNDGSLTIKNAVKGEEYHAYKVFDLTYQEPAEEGGKMPVSYTYTKSGENDALFTALTGDSSPFTLTESTVKGVYSVVLKDSASDREKISEFFKTNENNLTAVAISKATGLDAESKATGTEVKWDNLDYGYYYVTTSLGSLMTIDSTTKNAEIEEKNSVPTPSKTTDAASKNAQIGDTVNFTITFTNGKGTDTAVTLTDTMSQGLTLQTNSFTVKNGNETVAPANYTLNTSPTAEDVWTFQIVFNANYVKELKDNDVVTITYSATVNENATYSKEEENKLTLTYSNQTSTEQKSTVKTYKFEVLKYADGNKSKNLAGAVFELQKESKPINLVYISETKYRVATDEEVKAAESNTTGGGIKDLTTEGVTANKDDVVKNFITVASGNIEIDGVDVDTTNYQLVETKEPAGYNKLTQAKNVAVKDDNSAVIEVENKAGSTLPSTGGIGTTIFYIIGSILVIGAGVVLVSKRRMNAR